MMVQRLFGPAVALAVVAAFPPETVQGGSHHLYQDLPLGFEPKISSNVLFVAQGPGYGAFLKSDEAVLRLEGRVVARLRLLGAVPSARASGREPLPGRSNYLTGVDPSRWKTGVPHSAIALGDYDKHALLRIDPVLIYSTYLGGDTAVTGASDYARAVAVDMAGNVYIAGGTQSSAFPTSEGVLGRTFGGGSADAFVVKISAAGTLVYSTYLGGSSPDEAYGVAVDAAGVAWVAGYTDSRNFPVTADAMQSASAGGRDLFLAKIAPDGRSLAYSTYLGRSGSDEGRGLARDGAGNLWLAGRTGSSNFPIRGSALQSAYGGGSMDGFAVKFDPSGKNLLYATYLGGSGWDEANAVAVDVAGNAYVTGYANPSGFPVSANAWRKTAENTDAFAVKFDHRFARVSHDPRPLPNGRRLPDRLSLQAKARRLRRRLVGPLRRQPGGSGAGGGLERPGVRDRLGAVLAVPGDRGRLADRLRRGYRRLPHPVRRRFHQDPLRHLLRRRRCGPG